MVTYFIREHEWYTVPGVYGGDRCPHCNSATGIGFYSIVTCGARFNARGFARYLEFRNLSLVKGSMPRVYVRRFSSEQYTERQLKQQFKTVCDMELTRKVLSQPITVTENAT